MRYGRWIAIVAKSFVLMFVVTGSIYAAPANNNFSSRQLISTSLATIQTNFNYSSWEVGEPDPWGLSSGYAVGTVWYRYVSTKSGKVTFRVDPYGPFFRAAVYTGSSLSNLTAVQLAGVNQEIYFYQQPGVEYQIQLTGQNNDTTGFTLYFDATVPGNNDFSNRELISGSSGQVSNLTLRNASVENSETTCFNFALPNVCLLDEAINEYSIWYTWVAPATGWLDFTTIQIGNGITPSEIRVYQGNTLPTLTHLPKNYYVTAGSTYQIQVFLNGNGGYSPTIPVLTDDTGALGTPEFNFTWNLDQNIPVNDAFDSPTVVTGESGTLNNQSSISATFEINEPWSEEDYLLKGSVWYEWTAPYTGVANFTSSSSTKYISVYTGNSLEYVSRKATSKQPGASGTGVATFATDSGQTYKIQLFQSSGASNFSLNWYRTYPDISLSINAPAAALVSSGFTVDTTINTTGRATNVILSSTLPSGVTAVSLPSECNINGQVVTCVYGIIDTTTISSWVLSSNTTDTYNIAVSISQDGSEADTSNNAAQSTTLIDTSVADLSVATNIPASLDVDTQLDYNVDSTIDNLGPSDAENIVLSFTIPKYATVNFPPSGCIFTVDGTQSIVNCNIGTIATNTSYHLVIPVSINQNPVHVGEFTNIVEVSSSTTDPVSNNNKISKIITATGSCANFDCESVTVPTLPVLAQIVAFVSITFISIVTMRRKVSNR